MPTTERTKAPAPPEAIALRAKASALTTCSHVLARLSEADAADVAATLCKMYPASGEK